MTERERAVFAVVAQRDTPSSSREVASALGLEPNKAGLLLSQLSDEGFLARFAGHRPRYELTEHGRRIWLARSAS